MDLKRFKDFRIFVKQQIYDWQRNKPLTQRSVNFVYNTLRYVNIFNKYDFNEDFFCGTCGKPLLRRYLFCSEKCTELANF